MGQIQEFTVTFAYSHYVLQVMKGKDGNFIDEFVDNQISQITGLLDQGMESIGELASDAIGAGAAALGDAFNIDLPNPTKLASEYFSKVTEQVAISKDAMVSSIDDYIDKV
jgi:hypothetical protein